MQLMEATEGDDRPHDKHVPTADGLHDGHIEELQKEGLLR